VALASSEDGDGDCDRLSGICGCSYCCSSRMAAAVHQKQQLSFRAEEEEDEEDADEVLVVENDGFSFLILTFLFQQLILHLKIYFL
jgi:hypothetical protein